MDLVIEIQFIIAVKLKSCKGEIILFVCMIQSFVIVDLILGIKYLTTAKLYTTTRPPTTVLVFRVLQKLNQIEFLNTSNAIQLTDNIGKLPLSIFIMYIFKEV